MNNKLGRADNSGEPAPGGEDAGSTALPPDIAGLRPERDWKARIMFGLLAAGIIVTILWAIFVCALLALFVRSFF
jgi:hypothetical protein